MLTETQRRKPYVKPITYNGVLVGWRVYVRHANSLFGASFLKHIWKEPTK